MSEIDRDQYNVKAEPYYRLVGNEVEMYEAAYDARMPVMLKANRTNQSATSAANRTRPFLECQCVSGSS